MFSTQLPSDITNIQTLTDSELMELALHSQEEVVDLDKNLRRAFECYRKVKNPDLNLIEPLKKLMEQAYEARNMELFSCCCRELKRRISDFPQDYFVPEIHNKILASIILLADQIFQFYRKQFSKRDSQRSYLLYQATLLYEEISSFLTGDYKNPFISHFNQLAMNALAGQNPEFFVLLAEDPFSELESLLAVELRFPVFYQQQEVLAQLNTQLDQYLPSAISQLVLSYLPNSLAGFPHKEKIARAFVKIHQALLEGQSGPAWTRLQRLDPANPEEELHIASELAMKKNSRCKKALELATLYLNYTEDEWQFQQLFTEIYKYSFSHSGLGIFKRSQFLRNTFYRAQSLNNYLHNRNKFFSKSIETTLALDDKAFNRTRKIYYTLKPV